MFWFFIYLFVLTLLIILIFSLLSHDCDLICLISPCISLSPLHYVNIFIDTKIVRSFSRSNFYLETSAQILMGLKLMFVHFPKKLIERENAMHLTKLSDDRWCATINPFTG